MKEIGEIGTYRDKASPLTPTLSRLRERELLLPQAGEGWDEGVGYTSVPLKFLFIFWV